jgi:hypothetical protein
MQTQAGFPLQAHGSGALGLQHGHAGGEGNLRREQGAAVVADRLAEVMLPLLELPGYPGSGHQGRVGRTKVACTKVGQPRCSVQNLGPP